MNKYGAMVKRHWKRKIDVLRQKPDHILLIPRSKVFLKKLLVFQPVKKCSAIYETCWFSTAIESVRNLSLLWATSIQSTIPFYFLQIHLNIIYSSGEVNTEIGW